jgi:hypothetical protein
MSNIFSLICAIAFGLFLGTLPGVRERMPWGESSSDAQNAQLTTPAPVPSAAPASSGGGWMRESGRTSLDQPAPIGRTTSQGPSNSAHSSNAQPGTGGTMLSR